MKGLTKEEFLEYTNANGRNLLHEAAYFGEVGSVRELIQFCKKEAISLELKDARKYTALELACIRGFRKLDRKVGQSDAEVEESHKKPSPRSEIVKMLQQASPNNLLLLKSFKRKVNTPMHWAIYWADKYLAQYLAQQNPLLLFSLNQDKMVPFEMAFKFKSNLVKEYNRELIDQLVMGVYPEVMSRGLKSLGGATPASSGVGSANQGLGYSTGPKTLSGTTVKVFPPNYNAFEVGHLWLDEDVLKKLPGMAEAFLVQKVMVFLLMNDKLEEFVKVMKKYTISPFKRKGIMNNLNVIHFMTLYSQPNTLKRFFTINFEYEFNFKFEWPTVLKISTSDNLDTPAHLCCRYNRKEIFTEFKNLHVDLDAYNFRGWRPLDLAPLQSKFFNQERLEKIQEDRKKNTVITKKEVGDFWPSDELYAIDMEYDYCFVVSRDKEDTKDNTLTEIFKGVNVDYQVQKKEEERLEKTRKNPENMNLSNVSAKYAENGGDNQAGIITGFNAGNKDLGTSPIEKTKLVEFKKLPPLKRDIDYSLFLVKMTNACKQKYAEELQFKSHLKTARYTKPYRSDLADLFEPFSLAENEILFQYFIRKELDLSYLIKEGLIIDEFPVHKYLYRKTVGKIWGENYIPLLMNNIIPSKTRQRLSAHKIFTDYNGLQVGFFMALFSCLVSWLFVLSIPMTVFYFIDWYIYNYNANNQLLWAKFLTCCIWAAFFLSAWRRQQSEYSALFGRTSTQNKNYLRKEYRGDYVVDEVGFDVQKYDKFTPARRRLLVSQFYLNFFPNLFTLFTFLD